MIVKPKYYDHSYSLEIIFGNRCSFYKTLFLLYKKEMGPQWWDYAFFPLIFSLG